MEAVTDGYVYRQVDIKAETVTETEKMLERDGLTDYICMTGERTRGERKRREREGEIEVSDDSRRKLAGIQRNRGLLIDTNSGRRTERRRKQE